MTVFWSVSKISHLQRFTVFLPGFCIGDVWFFIEEADNRIGDGKVKRDASVLSVASSLSVSMMDRVLTPALLPPPPPLLTLGPIFVGTMRSPPLTMITSVIFQAGFWNKYEVKNVICIFIFT